MSEKQDAENFRLLKTAYQKYLTAAKNIKTVADHRDYWNAKTDFENLEYKLLNCVDSIKGAKTNV